MLRRSFLKAVASVAALIAPAMGSPRPKPIRGHAEGWPCPNCGKAQVAGRSRVWADLGRNEAGFHMQCALYVGVFCSECFDSVVDAHVETLGDRRSLERLLAEKRPGLRPLRFVHSCEYFGPETVA
jgi:hypothetical protein